MTRLNTPLNTTNHDRDIAGMTYVYPVVSRRAGGVSVGVNLNPNNACNWRCIYCQVPDLKRGAAPRIDLARLETELRNLLQDIVHGSFMQDYVPEGARRLSDIALSGNGESTSAKEFEPVIDLIGTLMGEFGLLGKIKLILITNGSLIGRPNVQRGLGRMALFGGEVWFKIDSATREGTRRINDSDQTPAKTFKNLAISAGLCPTWVQTCMFALDGMPPSAAEQDAYLALLKQAVNDGIGVKGVLLYGLARPSLQPEAERLARLTEDWMTGFAARIGQLGLEVKVSL